jgi:hypothetical protein|tara:strand:+ start:29 stop:220 length:192 start_codon:yes stop_codon:yes gene_type:complete
MEQSEINYLKTELVNDLVATTTVMEELWKYHPKNPNCTNILTEYEVLVKIKSDIERELSELKD